MAATASAPGSPTTTSPDNPRRPGPRRRSTAGTRWPSGASLFACVLFSPLLLIAQVTAGASAPSPRAVLDAGPTGYLPLPPPSLVTDALAVRALQASPRGKDDYDGDYGDDGDDYDDDYDYYGTRKKKKKKKPSASQAATSPIEVNIFNFVRVFVLRMVWGIASVFGFDEPLSEAFNGAFVPPGVDVDDDDGLGFDY